MSEYSYDDETNSEYSYNDENNSECSYNETKSIINEYDNLDYKIVTTDKLNNEIDDEINKLQTMTELSYDAILNLLLQYNWNVETIYSLYLDNELYQFENEQNTNINECSICFDTLDDYNKIQINNCNHIMCKECFINNYSINLSLRCPMYKCNNNCYLSIVLLHINDEEIKNKYKQYVVDDYVNVNKLIIYCPSKPYCGNVIIKQNYSCDNSIKCNCGETICFGCKKITDSHEPASCAMLNKWNLLLENESFNYINEKCKICPWCDRICEKVTGCNFLTCQTIKYKYWCWLCGGKVYNTSHTMTSIQGHTCQIKKQETTDFKDNNTLLLKYNNNQNSIMLDKKNQSVINQTLINSEDVLIYIINENQTLMITSRNYINNLYVYAYYKLCTGNINNNANYNLLMCNIEAVEYVLEFFASALQKYTSMFENNMSYEFNDSCEEYIDVLNKSKILKKQMHLINEFINTDD